METLQTEKNHRIPNAATRNIDLVADELMVFGAVSPEAWQMILDEERTQATEILTHQEQAYGVVPRQYYQSGDKLVDRHNQNLIKVIDDGVAEMQRQLSLGVPGADWELRRRQAERSNADKVLRMNAGSVCTEISASPYDKPKDEQLAQHYTDLTMIRLSHKVSENTVVQYNYVLPVSSPQFLRSVQDKFGRKGNNHLIASEALLENPIIENAYDQSPEAVAQRYDSLIGAALLEASVGHGAVRMLRTAIENRREAWNFVNSEQHSDLDQEMQAAMILAAELPADQRQKSMDAIRSGYWKELKDRFNGRANHALTGDIIMSAAARAVIDGDVFIACGNTVIATDFNNPNLSWGGDASVKRAEMVKTLREKVVGSGSCSACGAPGKLFGCGLCGACNKKWCDIYETTGRQTEIKDLAYLGYSRPFELSFSDGESISEAWQRINEEIRQKRQAKKLREVETTKLNYENLLSQAA